MIYDIRLTIAHDYDQPAANSRHLIRVLPATLSGRQQLTAHSIHIDPAPDERSEACDFFGAATTSCVHVAPHSRMSITMTSTVKMTEPPAWQDRSPDLDTLKRQWEACTSLSPEAPVHFLGPTARLAPDSAIADFSRQTAQATDSAAATVQRIGKALHDAMQFDSNATTVDTDASEAFRLRRGVCQDFSHIMILALQSLGIPAAYVSGYLRTLPPPGGVKLAGADAMHAWIRAWCGNDQGWIEYDPTNATLVGSDHIVVGYGRDYSDIPPVSGHLRSSGGQRNSQAVDVTRTD